MRAKEFNSIGIGILRVIANAKKAADKAEQKRIKELEKRVKELEKQAEKAQKNTNKKSKNNNSSSATVNNTQYTNYTRTYKANEIFSSDAEAMAYVFNQFFRFLIN